MASKITIVDYGMGNLNSVKRVLDRMKANPKVSSNPTDVAEADKIILPGVGHFGQAMSNLRELNLLDTLNEAVLVKKKPILGICLGMQLLANRSEEGDAEGLGWFDAEVVKFQVSDKLKYKIPHMGWNQIYLQNQSSLMRNIPELSEFYFVHSYYVKVNRKQDLLNETEYDCRFASAIEQENIFGVQYHPEKSHDTGAQLIKNFIEL